MGFDNFVYIQNKELTYKIYVDGGKIMFDEDNLPIKGCGRSHITSYTELRDVFTKKGLI